MQAIISFLKQRMEIPQPYGWFHLMFIGIMLTSCVLLTFFCKKGGGKRFRRVMFVLWLISFLFELYKQILFTFDYSPVNTYKMYVFPFQFCTMSIFFFPVIIWAKDGALRNAALLFCATFVFFGGFGLYMVPTSFQEYVGINIQTMVHHGIQIVGGVLIAVCASDKYTIKNFLRAMGIFVCVLAVAIALNEIVFPFLSPDNNDFNIFYISRHVVNQLPVLADIWHKSYPLFLAVYTFGFMGVSLLMYAIQKYIVKKVRYLKNRTAKG